MGVLAFTSNAQDAKQEKKGRNMPSVQERLDRMSTELNLTDAQKPKVKALLEEQNKQFAELRNVPQDQRREKMQAMRTEHEKTLKEILTPEQFEKWQKFMREQRGGKKGPDAEKGNGKKKTE